jgi:hypothetical protein
MLDYDSNMRNFISAAFLILLSSCSSLPVPGLAKTPPNEEARNILKQSAKRHGDPWKKYREVKVAYSGEWSPVASKLQPVLSDTGFRRTSVETYQPRSGKVSQIHKGPAGTKTVARNRPETLITFNGIPGKDREAIDSAALVADAYTAFLFGPSWLAVKGSDFHRIDSRTLDGERCHLIAGRLSPGFGKAGEDHFIAWIGESSGLMKRFQFTLNGLESTRGADVDVTFSHHLTAPDGSIWPSQFVEYIQRPILAKAHRWDMTSLVVDGRKIR